MFLNEHEGTKSHSFFKSSILFPDQLEREIEGSLSDHPSEEFKSGNGISSNGIKHNIYLQQEFICSHALIASGSWVKGHFLLIHVSEHQNGLVHLDTVQDNEMWDLIQKFLHNSTPDLWQIITPSQTISFPPVLPCITSSPAINISVSPSDSSLKGALNNLASSTFYIFKDICRWWECCILFSKNNYVLLAEMTRNSL